MSSQPPFYYVTIDPETRVVQAWYQLYHPASSENFLPISGEDYQRLFSLPGAQLTATGTIAEYSPPKTLTGQQAELSSLTAQKKAAGVYYQPTGASVAVLFPSDDTAYANALQEAQTVQLGAWTDGTQWTLSDGSSVPMTGTDVTGLFKRLAAYRAACQNRAAALNEALQKDLNADLTAGWPDNH